MAFDCLSFGVLDQSFGFPSLLWWRYAYCFASIFSIGFDLIAPVKIHNAWFWRICWCDWAVVIPVWAKNVLSY
jgi:hypothetical protein